MTDGSNHTSSLLYNSKLQPTYFEVSGNVVSQNFDYYNDGRISFVHNTTDPNFDRSYSYDHMARLTLATTGGAARGDFGATPYHEIFGYDALSNLTSRDTSSWGVDEFSDDASYSNNRRDGWGYDADGRNTTIDTRTYTFDASGQQTLMTGQKWVINHYAATSKATSYDGDGSWIKNVSDGIVTYYLRSSVLGGAIIEEINNNGQKNVGYVYYAGGRELAAQSNNEVIWKHPTPANNTKHEMHSSNGYAGRVEFDPAGADVKLQAPTAPDPGSGQGDVDFRHVGAMMDSKYAALNNPAGGCVVDDFETGCSNAMAVVNLGTGNSTAFVDNGSVTMHEIAHSVLLSASPQAIFAPAGNSLAGITPGDSDSDASKLISGGAAKQDQVTGNWSGEMTIAPATVTSLSTGVVSFAYSAELQKIDSFQRGLDNAITKTKGILQGGNDCSKFFGPDAIAALLALAKLIRLTNNYDQGQTTATGVRQDYASTIVVNGAQNTVAYRLPTSAQVYRNGPFFMGLGRKPLGGYPAGSLGAQITALLHELAHNIITDKKSKTLIPNDGGDPGLSVKNTEKILEHCAKEIFNAAK